MRQFFRSKSRKGKEIVGGTSNSEPDPEPETEPVVQSKRRQVVSSSEEETEEEMLERQPELPKWKSGPLSDQPAEHQANLFRWKMNTLINKKEGFVCEKEVPESEFGPFGVFDRFKAMGWEAALKCYDGRSKQLYADEIEEWMATLQLQVGNSPSQTKLLGTVKGKTVVMSFDTLRRIAKFDSKGGNRYKYPHLDDLYFKPEKHPTWPMMIDDLFIAERNPDKLLRDQLKIEARLLHLILVQNVMPRRGDKVEVRFSEVPVLFALMHGEPLVSFRYLVINNIWLSRESHERKMVPHCRLITVLLRNAGVITNESKGSAKRFSAFSIKNLGSSWQYKDSGNYHLLRSGEQRWRVLKPGMREISQEEEAAEMEESSGENEDVRIPEGPSGVGEDFGRAATSHGREIRSGQGVWARYPSEILEENWAHQGSMHDVICNARPAEYQAWPGTSQNVFDHITRTGASNERATKQLHDRNEQWQRAHAYAFQEEVNYRYEDDRRRRMHDQWHAGQEVVPDPPLVDYTTLPPYDGSVTYPDPPIHHSRWVDPRQDPHSQAPQQEEGAFGFGQFADMFSSIFGPPQPRYY